MIQKKQKKYIRKECYFTNDISKFSCITDALAKGTLTSIKDNDEPYQHKGILSEFNSSFILPCEWVIKEKKYRPYTLQEFIDKFTVGQPIKYREKGNEGSERYLILNGYQHEQRKGQTTTFIYIGSYPFTLDELFNAYEWQVHYTEDFEPLE